MDSEHLHTQEKMMQIVDIYDDHKEPRLTRNNDRSFRSTKGS